MFLFNNMFVGDALSGVLKFAACAVTAVSLCYSRSYIAARGMFRVEFYALALFAVLGMLVMISANHFMVLYLGLELMSLSIYAMVALQRDSTKSTEAALKYFVLGALASGMLLFGMSMLYGANRQPEYRRCSAENCQWWRQSGAEFDWCGIRGCRSGIQTGCSAIPYVGTGRI